MYDDALLDLKESFNWGIDLEGVSGAGHDPEAAPANPLLGPNVWPAAMPELEADVYPYFEAASACAEDLLRGFALGAGLDPEHFIRLRDRPVSRGSLQYYPRSRRAPGGSVRGGPAHRLRVLTVLCQDAVGGLEIRRRDGEWAAMPPIPGALVVNIGDLLERWSNRRYRSTVHRVINTSGREASRWCSPTIRTSRPSSTRTHSAPRARRRTTSPSPAATTCCGGSGRRSRIGGERRPIARSRCNGSRSSRCCATRSRTGRTGSGCGDAPSRSADTTW